MTRLAIGYSLLTFVRIGRQLDEFLLSYRKTEKS